MNSSFGMAAPGVATPGVATPGGSGDEDGCGTGAADGGCPAYAIAQKAALTNQYRATFNRIPT
ncbi:MAG TPA: hypothetical protein VNR70_06925 [Steroidobacteraceae bacterium]|nr:hypothetical protein [Steroidobacteraceae bacterium]